MVNRFVHYTQSKQADSQPVLLGTSVVRSNSEEGRNVDIIGGSFDLSKMPITQQEAIVWAIKYLLSNNTDKITMDGIETRRARQ